jgi:hypothetical protein
MVLCFSHFCKAESGLNVEGRIIKHPAKQGAYILLVNENTDSEILIDLKSNVELKHLENKNISMKLKVEKCEELNCKGRVIEVRKLILPNLKTHFIRFKDLLNTTSD